MNRRFVRDAVLLAIACFLLLPTARAADRPQWGVRWTRNMVSQEVGLPDTFSPGERMSGSDAIDPTTTENVRWSAVLGSRAYASPVVAEGRVLIGTNNDHPREKRVTDDRGVLLCFDEETGDFQWQLLVPKRDHERFFDSPKTGITSTPTVVDGRVYLMTNRCEIVCLDLDGMADGNDGPFTDEAAFLFDPEEDAAPREPGPRDADILWSFDIVRQLGVRSHDAASCCPLVHRGLVYCGTANGLDVEHAEVAVPEAPALIVLDALSGEYLARDDDWVGDQVVHGQWSSPAMGRIGGRDLIVYGGGNGRLFAFEPLAREKLRAETRDSRSDVHRIAPHWWFDGQPERQTGQSHDFQSGRGSASFTCVATPVIDKDRVYMAFSNDPWMGAKKGYFACIDGTGQGDITQSGLLWSKTLRRESLSSPSIVDGLIYLADNGGTVYCFEADGGEILWTYETNATCWGSTLWVDGRLILGTSRRDLFFFAPGHEAKVLQQIRLRDAIWNTATAAGGTLYIATGGQLYAVAKDER